ncbi:MAG: 3'-5' exonuclease domain-containing protein 2 [Muribaculum sp.]|nr:3'-5' exonuclease domain-containing protein 2 [Muribaculum sp.]
MTETAFEYHVTISKEELSKLPAERYEGHIHLIDTPDKVGAAIERLRHEGVIGFDTETRPCFKKGQHHKVALLQLSSHTDCWLFRLNKTGLTDDILDFLEDPEITKIGLSIHDDFHNLRNLRPIEPKGFIDLQPFVKDYLISDNSLARIYSILFGKRISKSQQLSNWEATNLTSGQQHYAALDARACISIYDYISSGKFIPQDSPYYKPIPKQDPVKES